MGLWGAGKEAEGVEATKVERGRGAEGEEGWCGGLLLLEASDGGKEKGWKEGRRSRLWETNGEGQREKGAVVCRPVAVGSGRERGVSPAAPSAAPRRRRDSPNPPAIAPIRRVFANGWEEAPARLKSLKVPNGIHREGGGVGWGWKTNRRMGVLGG